MYRSKSVITVSRESTPSPPAGDRFVILNGRSPVAPTPFGVVAGSASKVALGGSPRSLRQVSALDSFSGSIAGGWIITAPLRPFAPSVTSVEFTGGTQPSGTRALR